MKILLFLCLLVPASSHRIHQRIVGGSTANIIDPFQFPHQVSLRVHGEHNCGGTLISSIHILTAAHCVDDVSVDALSSFHRYIGIVESIIIHPDYTKDPWPQLKKDIAVVRIAPVTFSKQFAPIPLASSTDGDFAGGFGTIYGWGRTTAGYAIPALLQEATVSIISNDQCSNISEIAKEQICALGQTTSPFAGNDGGPLVSNGKLVGVLSKKANGPGLPSIYTRISSHYDWITTTCRLPK